MARAQVLGVSFGELTTTVEVREVENGHLVAQGRGRHVDLGANVDIDDPTAWWRSLVAAVARAGERDIAAISVCGAHPGLVLLDGAGAVLRPMQVWAEADGEHDAALLRRTLGADEWVRRAGMLPDTRTAVTRLAWLRRTDPATYERIGAVLLPHDWLTYRLAGRAVTDRGSASLTGAWSPAADGWITEVFRALGGTAREWEARLPEVLGPHDRADWLAAPVYDLLGLRGRPLVAAGTGEPMAVALALGLRPGRVGVRMGANTTVLAAIKAPIADPSGEVRSLADATGHHLAIAAVPGGAALIEALADLLELHADELGALALAAPDAGGATAVPHVPGRAGAVLAGLVPGLTRAGLARAAFDGVAAATLDALDRVTAAGAVLDIGEPIRLTGPAPGLEAHAQTLATLADRAVLSAPAGGSLAAAGACIQAAAVLLGDDPETVAEAWNLGGDRQVDPEDAPERATRRLAQAQERTRHR